MASLNGLRDPRRRYLHSLPNANPRLYVTAASKMPTQVISRPDAHHDRLVINDFRAPTMKCAAMLTINAAITAAKPCMKKNGMMGMNAPTAVEAAAEKDDVQGLGK